MIDPDTLHEGELRTGMQNARVTQGTEGSVRENAAQQMDVESESEEPQGLRANLRRKRSSVEEENEHSPHRTRGKCIDYCHLHDPFSNNEDDEEIVNAAAVVCDETFSVAANDGEPTLKEAKRLNKWPEWEKAIKAKLAQLKKMGTWRLIKKPKHAIPIANKWVFAKKRNKAG